MLIDQHIETIGNIEYWRTPIEYEARCKGYVIRNKDLDRLKQDAPAVIDLLTTWIHSSTNESDVSKNESEA